MDRPALCAQCRARPVDPAWRPFCSPRCQVLDQARWAEGTYRVPGRPAAADDTDPSASDDDE